MMENLSFKVKPVLKIAGMAILGLIAVYIAFTLLAALFGSFSGKIKSGSGSSGGAMYLAGDSKSEMKAPMAAQSQTGGMLGLSTRNAESSASYDSIGYSPSPAGNQSEEYEVTEYNARIETRQLKKACAAVSGLKAREDVIFEYAREYGNGCNYTFKVDRDKTDEILAIIKKMNPKELAGNTYTIKGQVDDYTGEIDILQKKLAAIDDTLGKAMAAYDEVAQIATSAKDADSLAKVINSKVGTIERLAQERINVDSRLDRIGRDKALQLDRLDYTNFSVNIYDGGFVDGQDLKDSWKAAVKLTISQINQTIQNISINLAGFLFFLFQYAIYALILLIAAKYGWRMVKHIWQEGE